MIRELKGMHNYAKVILLLSVLTFISGLLSSFLGELFLPFSSGIFAALLLFENPKKRIFSYVVPISTFAISIAVNGIYGIVSLNYAAIALIIYLCYIRSVSKAECSIYVTITASLFIIFSLYLSAATTIGSFEFNEVANYFLELYQELKEYLIGSVKEYYSSVPEANQSFSAETIEIYFDSLSNILVSIIGIIAFVITGISIKLFTKLALHYSKNGILKSFAHFIPSAFAAYAYIALTVISIFITKNTILNSAIINASNILMVVFVYIGIQYILLTGKLANRKSTVYTFIAISLLVIPSIALQIVSYLGVWLILAAKNVDRTI